MEKLFPQEDSPVLEQVAQTCSLHPSRVDPIIHTVLHMWKEEMNTLTEESRISTSCHKGIFFITDLERFSKY